MSGIFSELLTGLQMSQDKATLQGGADTSKINKELLSEILKLYTYKDPYTRVIAAILLAAFSEQKATFLFSRDIVENLLEKDHRIRRNTLSGTDYGKLWSKMVGGLTPSFEVLRQDNSESFQTKKTASGKLIHRASVLTIRDPKIKAEFINMIGSEFLEVQRTQTIALFDNFNQIPDETSNKTSTRETSTNVKANAEAYANADAENKNINLKSSALGLTKKQEDLTQKPKEQTFSLETPGGSETSVTTPKVKSRNNFREVSSKVPTTNGDSGRAPSAVNLELLLAKFKGLGKPQPICIELSRLLAVTTSEHASPKQKAFCENEFLKSYDNNMGKKCCPLSARKKSILLSIEEELWLREHDRDYEEKSDDDLFDSKGNLLEEEPQASDDDASDDLNANAAAK